MKYLENQHDITEVNYFSEWRERWRQEKRIPIAIRMLPRNLPILDIGCRWGDVTNEIYKRNKNVVGVDFSKESLKIGWKEHPHLKLSYGDATDLPFDNEVFDAVFMGEIIEHILDQEKAMQEAHRVLKKGGVVVMTTPNFCSLRRRIRIMLGKSIDSDVVHYRVLTKVEIEELFERNGFRICRFIADGIKLSRIKMPCFKLNWGDVFIIKAVKKEMR